MTLQGVTIADDGQLKVDSVSFKVQHFNESWNIRPQVASYLNTINLEVITDSSFLLEAMFQTHAPVPYHFIEQVTAQPNGYLNLSYSLGSDNQEASKGIFLSATLPAYDFAGKKLTLDGQTLTLPKEFTKVALAAKKVKSLRIPLNGKYILLEGDFEIFLQDNRSFQHEEFDLRVLFKTTNQYADASLSLEMAVREIASTPIDLSGVATRAFTDGTAGDGMGGWTDQGPENDLRMIEPGLQAFSGVKMNILDEQSQPNTCIALAGPTQTDLPSTVTVEQPYPASNYLYLLQALAWAPPEPKNIGQILVRYADGEQQTITVNSGRDVGDWWAPYPLDNGAVAWTGENRHSYVGLFLSRFPIENKPIQSISFHSEGQALWLIAAASLSQEPIDIFSTATPHYIVADAQWKPIEQHIDIEAGSALDFSFLVDAPAGKYGPVIRNGSHFAFENKPDEAVRFYGANLSFSANFLDKKACDEVVERFCRIGYNSVRFHHFDEDLKLVKDGQGTELNPEALDKMDYLFYRFKEKGIYITTDLYVSRIIEEGEFSEYDGDRQYVMKALAPIYKSAMDNWKAFTKNLLTHVNPYTGMTWGEDPALFSLSLINESAIYHVWQVYPEIKQLYLQRFEQWVQDNDIAIADEAERQERLSEFLVKVQIDAVEEMKAYVRSLGCNALITDVNFKSPIALSVVRNHLDYVDNHVYWDHPNFIGEKIGATPSAYHNKSAVMSWAGSPTEIMASRLLDKPFMVTEFNFCLPNEYRAEGGPLMGAYASLQDWSGIYRYAYSHRDSYVNAVQSARGYDLVADPISALSERMGLLFFLRKDIPAAKKVYAYLFDDTATKNLGSKGFPTKFKRLGLFARVGTLHTDNIDTVRADDYFSWQSIPGVPDAKVWEDKDFEELSRNNITANDIVIALDGQIMMNVPEGDLHVTSPESEAAVLNGQKDFHGTYFDAKTDGRFNTIGLASLDGQPLPGSRRILVLHLTNVYNTKTRFQTSQRHVVQQWGELPHLVEAGKVKLKIKSDQAEGIQVYALKLNGERKAECSFRIVNGAIELDLNTHDFDGTLAYEIVKN